MPFRPPIFRPPGQLSPEASRLAYERQRGSSTARGYDNHWRKLRDAFIAENPLCCEPGCDQPSTDADHILSVRKRPDLRLAWHNLRPYCHGHHSARTARDQSWGTRTRKQ
jgi:5-methylcytosine-specific restriction protein A